MGKRKDVIKVRRTFTIEPDISAKLDLLAAKTYVNNISYTVNLILGEYLMKK